MKKEIIRKILFCLLSISTVSCKVLGTNEHLFYGGDTEENVHLVSIQNFSFQPATLSVELGDRIIFTNLDEAIHNVAPTESSPFQFEPSPLLSQGEKFIIEIAEDLDMDIFCEVHPRMPGLKVFIRN